MNFSNLQQPVFCLCDIVHNSMITFIVKGTYTSTNKADFCGDIFLHQLSKIKSSICRVDDQQTYFGKMKTSFKESIQPLWLNSFVLIIN